MTVTERFLKYVSFETTSDPTKKSSPSTNEQKALGKEICSDLKEMGIDNVCLDEYGYVYAKIPSNSDRIKKKIGLIAHMDTSPEVSGKDVRPSVVRYTGEDILLNKDKNIVLSSKEFTNIDKYKNKDIIVTDGTTLLGADDKAGIAEILTAVNEIIISGSEHGEIYLAFTPDEEIGRGTDNFTLALCNADYAYTVDGGELGEIGYENFNAASAEITIKGRSVHPGSAKEMMINASRVAIEFNSMLPQNDIPEKTEDHEGFFHLCSMTGDVEKAELSYIIRDHDKKIFDERKKRIVDISNILNKKYGEGTVSFSVEDSYYNMKPLIEDKMFIVENIKKAMLKENVLPVVIPIRGGTDGAVLTYKGLPCPNIGTGGENFHSRFEYIPVESMEKTVKIIKNLITDAF